MDKNVKKRTSAAFISRLELVHAKAAQTAKMFQRDNISVAGFKNVIEELKGQPNDKIGDGKIMLEKFNELLDAIFNTCKSYVEDNRETHIPIEFIQILVGKQVKDLKKMLV